VTDPSQVTVPSAQGTQRFHTVCKRVFQADPAYFPKAEYRGRTVYFCTESCLGAFLADPDVFFKAHGTLKTFKDHAEAR